MQTNPLSGTGYAYRGVWFTDANKGTAVGDAGTISRTNDGGATWLAQSSGVSSTLLAVSFYDADHGIIVGAGGVLLTTTNGSLPVELVSFTASRGNGGALLEWTTASEVRLFGFEIERSVAAQGAASGWLKTGFVPASGSSNTERAYTFTDKNPPEGVLKYRLKSIDIDGSFRYSECAEIAMAAPKAFSLERNYPNPFNPSTSINFSLASDGGVVLRVFDVLGRCVATLANEEMKAGTLHTRTFDGSLLASGVYYIRLESGNLVQVRKAILMK